MKLAIFDVDGTLTDTNGIDESSHLQAFREAYRIDNISTDWSQYENATDPGLIQEIFEDHFGRKPDPEQILHFRQTFLRILKSAAQNNHGAFREIQGALRMLELLADDPQWRIAIATGCFRESAFLKLEAAGIPFSGFPLASGDDGITRGEIIKQAIASGEAYYEAKSFSRIVYVGDAVWDVRTSKALHVPFVGIGKNATRLDVEGARYVFPDYLNPGPFIQCLNNAQPPV